MSDAWYLHDGKKQFGPFTVHELIAKLATYPNPLGIFTWRAGFEGWRSSGDVPELANLLSAPPPPCLPTLKADPESRIGLSEAKGTASHNNFIAKNWRGEYPLWVTYWIFNFLGGVILFGIASVAGEVLFANAASLRSNSVNRRIHSLGRNAVDRMYSVHSISNAPQEQRRANGASRRPISSTIAQTHDHQWRQPMTDAQLATEGHDLGGGDLRRLIESKFIEEN
jgi:hypothetical protein